jgi:hypothetical protein
MLFKITYRDADCCLGEVGKIYTAYDEAEEDAADLMVRLLNSAKNEQDANTIRIEIRANGGSYWTFTRHTEMGAALARFNKKKSAANPKEPKVIDLTPTWSGILPALLLVLESGTAEGRKMVREELVRMAAAADQANAK